MKVDTLHQLFEHSIISMLDAERQLVEALPEMAKAASHSDLRQGFEEHLKQTKEHVTRLEQICENLNIEGDKRKVNKAMRGIIESGQEHVQMEGQDNVKDMGLVGAAQKTEHFEMAAYIEMINLAEIMGHDEEVEILRQTLMEEEATSQKLSQLSENELLSKIEESEVM